MPSICWEEQILVGVKYFSIFYVGLNIRMHTPRAKENFFYTLKKFHNIIQAGLEYPSTNTPQINLPRPWSFLALSFIGSIGSCKEENIFSIHKMQTFVNCKYFTTNSLPSALMRATHTIQFQILEIKNSMQSIRCWKLLKSFHFQHQKKAEIFDLKDLDRQYLNIYWSGAGTKRTRCDLCRATCKLQIFQHGSGVGNIELNLFLE